MLTLTSIDRLVTDLFTYFIYLSGTVIVGVMVWSGIMIATAAGDETKYKKGKTMMRQAVIGGAAVLAVGLIVNTIARIAMNPSDVLR